MRQIEIETLQTAVQVALRAWNQQKGDDESFLEMLFLVKQERERIGGNSPTANRLATNEVLHNAIEFLRKQDNKSAELLHSRFVERDKLQKVANQLHLSLDQVKRRQREAIQSLTQILWDQEMAVRAAKNRALKNQLPSLGYNQLVGVEQVKTKILRRLIAEVAPWLIAIVGIGGIGKTTLANYVVRESIDRFMFEQVVWVRVEKSPSSEHHPDFWHTIVVQIAKQCGIDLHNSLTANEAATQLRHWLKTTPTLIVIDNIESKAALVSLAQEAKQLTNPSKFLLTSRVRLPVDMVTWSIFLEQLPQSESYQLIRQKAQIIGLSELANAKDSDLWQIYEKVGGNPFALELIVGLAQVLPLPKILENLVSVNHQAIADLYRHIFWQSWKILSEHGRQLLELMPIGADVGMSINQLKGISQLDEKQLSAAITELANRSLIEVRGNAWERRYGIHRLTESFLQSEIIHWPGEMGR